MNKKKNNKIAAVLLASGVGERFSGSIPKQYKKINNKTILEISLRRFINNNKINSLYIVYNKLHEKYINSLKKKFTQVYFVEGSDSRQKSSQIALNLIHSKKIYNKILIHDAVRPFVSDLIINKLIAKLEIANGVIPVLKITDSIKYIKNNQILKNVDRNNLYFAQTPQGFLVNKLKNAYYKIKEKNLKMYTDDSQIFTAAGFKVKVINGHDSNIKITTQDDYLKAKKMLLNNNINIVKVGLGIDFHKFTKGNMFILFGIKIPFNKSIKAHSDGDIGVHALIDAILGTLSIGDIGTNFPDSDKKFRNISSLKLLDKTLIMLKKNKGKIIHIDNTIICEKPKLQEFILEMRKKMANTLNIKLSSFSIKATTTEKMDAIGNVQGLAVHTIATIKYAK